MEVKFGEGTTEFGPGVNIEMTGDEVATAINAWLAAHGVCFEALLSLSRVERDPMQARCTGRYRFGVSPPPRHRRA